MKPIRILTAADLVLVAPIVSCAQEPVSVSSAELRTGWSAKRLVR